MQARGVRTTISTDLIVTQGLLLGIALSLLLWPVMGGVVQSVGVGGALGMVLAAVNVSRRREEVSVDEGGVRLRRRGRVASIPHDDIVQVIAEPTDAAGFRGRTGAVAVTLHREGAAPLRLDVAAADADALLAAISAPMVRRWSAALGRGELLEFRDPREFPLAAVLRGFGVSFGALFLVVSAVLGQRFDLFFLVAMFGVGISSALAALRAVRAWRSADRGGGLAVSSQGVLHLASVPRRRVAAPVYRAAAVGGPWIPWSALRAVRREGYGLVLETDSVPARIQLSASTEGAAPLGLLLQQHAAAADVRVRVDGAPTFEPAAQDVTAEAPARGSGRA